MFQISGLSSVKSGLNICDMRVSYLEMTDLDTWFKCKALDFMVFKPSIPGASWYRKSPRLLFPSFRSCEENLWGGEWAAVCYWREWTWCQSGRRWGRGRCPGWTSPRGGLRRTRRRSCCWPSWSSAPQAPSTSREGLSWRWRGPPRRSRETGKGRSLRPWRQSCVCEGECSWWRDLRGQSCASPGTPDLCRSYQKSSSCHVIYDKASHLIGELQ